MNRGNFRNREYRIVFSSVLFTFAIIIVMVCVYTGYQWSNLNRELIDRNISLIGRIVNDHPELEETVIAAFTRDMEEEELKVGLNLAERYGYTSDFPINASPVINNSFIKSIYGNIFIILVGLIIVLLLLYKIFNQIFESMNGISLGAENIMRGNFDIKFPEEGEGELPKLGFQFNQMSKRLQLTMEALNEEKSMLKDMISNISHQLKTPLASLRMFNELLLDGAAEDKDVRQEFLEKSMTQLERMEWLIHTLLKISRLEVGVIEFNKDTNDLPKTIRQVVDSLEVRCKEKRLVVCINEEAGPVYLLHDSKWIGEALGNIIKNAIDYTPEHGKIDICICKNSSTAGIIIKDTGIGIPQDELPYIFKRFYQGKMSRGISKKGSGIGLALAKLIIERHGGLINVSSKVNEGTTFSITFPVA